MLKDKVKEIIKKYRIDAIYGKDGVSMNWAEVCKDFACNYAEILGEQIEGLRLAVYPGGTLGKQVADILSACSCRIECIIDNYIQDKEYMGIPILSYEEWLYNHCTEAVLLCSKNPGGDVFYNQLVLDGYTGKIVDVYKCLTDTYKNLEPINNLGPVPEPDGDISKAGYKYINSLELKYADAKGMEKADLLRRLIYTLFAVKDFCYAEKYIEEIETSKERQKYKNAIAEIKDAISRVVESPEIDNVMFVHIFDSFPECMIERMPTLLKIAEEGIRVKGIVVQYPITHYAINMMFSGRGVFETELEREKMEWEDSELLRYLQEKQIEVDYISCGVNKLRIAERDGLHKIQCNPMISVLMFEGLCRLEDTPKDHLIIIHSMEEIHSPCFSIGIGQKLKHVEFEELTRDEMISQYNHALMYVDKQTEWYFPFYRKTGGLNLIMGDHGGDIECLFNVYHGIKKDLGYINKNSLLPAFIIDGLDKGGGKIIEGMIPNRNLPDVILDILKAKTGHGTLSLEKYIQDYVLLQAPPLYSEKHVRTHLPKGTYGIYEGYIGVKTAEEIYLLSASGRELYFRPDEYQYRNLVNVNAYHDDVRRCRDLLEGQEYPIEIYGLEKYKLHMERLEQYDEECFRKIMDKLSEKSK